MKYCIWGAGGGVKLASGQGYKGGDEEVERDDSVAYRRISEVPFYCII
jgi:hypothetical protein